MGFKPAIKIIIPAFLIVLYSGCSEAPVYYGKNVKKPAVKSRSRVEKPVTHLDIDFSPPVYNFRVSRVTSRFGVRKNTRYNFKEIHKGIDIKLRTGDPVLAAAPGVITFAGNKRGYGKVIIISHGQRIYTVYAHLSSIDRAKGVLVERGEVIGRGGRSGNATGSHLHFEIRKSGTAIDPIPYLSH